MQKLRFALHLGWSLGLMAVTLAATTPDAAPDAAQAIASPAAVAPQAEMWCPDFARTPRGGQRGDIVSEASRRSPLSGQVGRALLDQGLLDPVWFGDPALEFNPGRRISFYWIKPGLQLRGKSLQIQAWEAPVMLRKDATSQDREKALALTRQLPSDLQKGLQKHLERNGNRLLSEAGDFTIIGRIVDYHGGSVLTKAQTVALMSGAWVGPVISKGFKKHQGKPADDGMECVTFDLKILDAKTHELVLGIHEKSYNPFNAEKSFEQWSRHLGHFLAEGQER